jgi:hypothetical protein
MCLLFFRARRFFPQFLCLAASTWVLWLQSCCRFLVRVWLPVLLQLLDVALLLLRWGLSPLLVGVIKGASLRGLPTRSHKRQLPPVGCAFVYLTPGVSWLVLVTLRL